MENESTLDVQIPDLRRQGASLSAIAARLGISKTAVFRCLKELETSTAVQANTQPIPKELVTHDAALKQAKANLRAQQKLAARAAEAERQRQYRHKLREVCVSLGHALESLELEEPISEDEYQELRQFLRLATRTLREASLTEKELKLADQLYGLVNPLIKDLAEQHNDLNQDEDGLYVVNSMTLSALHVWIMEGMGLVRG